MNFLVNLSVNLSVNSSFQQILVIWTLFINLKALNTIGRHVPNVLVIFEIMRIDHHQTSTPLTWKF